MHFKKLNIKHQLRKRWRNVNVTFNLVKTFKRVKTFGHVNSNKQFYANANPRDDMILIEDIF